KNPMRVGASLTPENAMAMIGRRAGILATGRGRASIAMMTVRAAIARTVDRGRIFVRGRTAMARSVRSSRAATGRTLIATTVRRAGIAMIAVAMPVRRHALPRGNLATSGRIRRAAKAFARTVIVLAGIAPLVHGRRVTAIVL